MERQHTYKTQLQWTGNRGEGTKTYSSYDRSYSITVKNKPDILGSSDPTFRGDLSRYNPEELLVASLSSCHMLWYLHVCAVHHVTVLDYTDTAIGTMQETSNGGGHFTEVVLHPVVTIAEAAKQALAIDLHNKAHKLCFIANSCNFLIRHQPTCQVLSR